ncbi:MAG: ATP-binding protein [Patescibacteria group bacterium]
MKLRTKVFVFFGIFLLALLGGVIFYAQYVVGTELKNQTTRSLRVNVEQAEGAYYTFLRSLKREAIGWTANETIQDIGERLVASKAGTPERDRAAKEFASYITNKKMPLNKDLLMADIIDKNGIVMASTRPTRIGTDELREEVEIKAHSFSKTLVSNIGEAFVKSIIFEEDETPEPMIHVTVRLLSGKADGTYKPIDAVLLIHFVNVKEIADVLSGNSQAQNSGLTNTGLLASYKSSEIYLVNSKKVMVTPSRYVPDIKQQQTVDTLSVRECLENGKEVDHEYDDYRGIPVFGVSVCLPDDGLVLVVEVDKSEIFAPIQTLVNTTAVGGGTVLFFGLIIVVIFVRRPLRMIEEIVAGFERVIKGDLTAEVKVHTKDELGYLATMFNKMVLSIRQNQKILQESNSKLEKNESALMVDIKEHEKQGKVLDDARRATQNLLEDSVEVMEKSRAESSKLQTILASVADGIVIIDGNHIVTLMNPKAAVIFAMPVTEILGKDLREIMKLCRDKVPVAKEEWPTEEMFLTKKEVTTTVEDNFCVTTKGREIPLPISLSVAPLSGGGLSGGVIVISDSTADQELNEAKSGFISVASHQLRTPLTSIRWYSEMLLSEDAGTLNPAQKDFMNEIHGGAERLYQTVDLLLGISRVESGKIKTDKTAIDIGVFTAEIKKEIEPQMYEKKLVLTIVPSERDPVIVWLDSLTLRQVILNLISNAIRYTNENGIIEIKYWFGDNGKEVVYMVHDNGIGISEKERPRIFSKFFRAENARSQVPDGSGLGLSLVKDLVESWGGKVWFESKEGEGTTFFFTVPLTTQVEGVDIPK